jgi:hypothetical protein
LLPLGGTLSSNQTLALCLRVVVLNISNKQILQR